MHSGFPQVLASSGDSDAPRGPCRKAPHALYIKSGKEWISSLPFVFAGALTTAKNEPALGAASAPRQRWDLRPPLDRGVTGRDWRFIPSSSSPQEAEGMTRRICEDPPAPGVDVKQRGTGAENLLLGQVEVRDIKVQMKLLRICAVRPAPGNPSHAGTPIPGQSPCEGSRSRRRPPTSDRAGRPHHQAAIGRTGPVQGRLDNPEPRTAACRSSIPSHSTGPPALVSHGPTRRKAQHRTAEPVDLSRNFRRLSGTS